MDALAGHAAECECNPSKLPEWMVSSNPIPDPVQDEPSEGTTSLRMRLFKSGKADLMGSAATGGMNIFSMSSSDPTGPSIQAISELTHDLVKSSDVINRNSQQIAFIDLSDDD